MYLLCMSNTFTKLTRKSGKSKSMKSLKRQSSLRLTVHPLSQKSSKRPLFKLMAMHTHMEKDMDMYMVKATYTLMEKVMLMVTLMFILLVSILMFMEVVFILPLKRLLLKSTEFMVTLMFMRP